MTSSKAIAAIARTKLRASVRFGACDFFLAVGAGAGPQQ